jgi:hypothetical protein
MKLSNTLVQRRILPLYHGPSVKLRLQPSSREYTVSKDLLCAKSKVFSAMFNGHFRESAEHTATLEEMEGVVAARSLNTLLQWMYLGVLNIGYPTADLDPRISAAIEFARLADLYDITGLEDEVAGYIKKELPKSWPLSSAFYLTSRHISWASCLPRGHAVRRVLAAASVARVFLDGGGFAKMTEEYPTFAADVLQEMKLEFRFNELHGTKVAYTDPITGKKVYMPPS